MEFYYFGDLDSEGISIWYELQKEQQVDIKPFIFFYETLFDIYCDVAQPLRKNQRISKEATDSFLQYLSIETKSKVANLLYNKLYIPQEGLNYQLLDELSD